VSESQESDCFSLLIVEIGVMIRARVAERGSREKPPPGSLWWPRAGDRRLLSGPGRHRAPASATYLARSASRALAMLLAEGKLERRSYGDSLSVAQRKRIANGVRPCRVESELARRCAASAWASRQARASRKSTPDPYGIMGR
jgi:hypothetical protein